MQRASVRAEAPCGQDGDRGGIEPAAEMRAGPARARQTTADGLVHQTVQLARGLLRRTSALPRHGLVELPIARQRNPVARHLQEMGGRQPLDACDKRIVVPLVADQAAQYGVHVDLLRDDGTAVQRLRKRRERKQLAGLMHVGERAHAEYVARRDEPVCVPVPACEREIAEYPPQTRRTVAFQRRHKQFVFGFRRLAAHLPPDGVGIVEADIRRDDGARRLRQRGCSVHRKI